MGRRFYTTASFFSTHSIDDGTFTATTPKGRTIFGDIYFQVKAAFPDSCSIQTRKYTRFHHCGATVQLEAAFQQIEIPFIPRTYAQKCRIIYYTLMKSIFWTSKNGKCWCDYKLKYYQSDIVNEIVECDELSIHDG